jgi:hypothetical protein
VEIRERAVLFLKEYSWFMDEKIMRDGIEFLLYLEGYMKELTSQGTKIGNIFVLEKYLAQFEKFI